MSRLLSGNVALAGGTACDGDAAVTPLTGPERGLGAALRHHYQQDTDDGARRRAVPPGFPFPAIGLERLFDGQAFAQWLEPRHLLRAIPDAGDPGEQEHEPEVPHQSPLKTGFLFSRKAVVPSRLSADSNVIACAVDSKASPAESGIWLDALSAALARRTASGPRASSWPASARAASISSGSGTTRLTRPTSSARAASHRAPVRI